MTLARLAKECKDVVIAKEKVVGAAKVLQRAWRGVLAKRIGDLERDVLGFQGFARGWICRRLLDQGKGKGKGKNGRGGEVYNCGW